MHAGKEWRCSSWHLGNSFYVLRYATRLYTTLGDESEAVVHATAGARYESHEDTKSEAQVTGWVKIKYEPDQEAPYRLYHHNDRVSMHFWRVPYVQSSAATPNHIIRE